jgi:hypothetical protein
LWALPLVTACAGIDDASEMTSLEVQILDSAGVRIVDLGAGCEAPTTWQLELLNQIGCLDCTDEGQLLSSVTAGALLPEGAAVISMTQPARVAEYDATGRFLGDLGGAGVGPREFTLPDRVQALTDGAVMVHDQGSFRTHWFGADRDHYRVWPDDRGPSGRPSTPAGWVAGPTEVAFEVTPSVGGSGAPALRQGAIVVRAAGSADPVAVAEHLDAYHGRVPPQKGGFTAQESVLFGPRASIAPDSGGVWYGFPSTLGFTRFDLSGTVTDVVRSRCRGPRISSVERDAYRADLERRRREATRQGRTVLADRLGFESENLVFADAAPAFRRFRVAKAGDVLWVETHPDPARAEMSRTDLFGMRRARADSVVWLVVDVDRGEIGRVPLPPRSRLLDVSGMQALYALEGPAGEPVVHRARVRSNGADRGDSGA